MPDLKKLPHIALLNSADNTWELKLAEELPDLKEQLGIKSLLFGEIDRNAFFHRSKIGSYLEKNDLSNLEEIVKIAHDTLGADNCKYIGDFNHEKFSQRCHNTASKLALFGDNHRTKPISMIDAQMYANQKDDGIAQIFSNVSNLQRSRVSQSYEDLEWAGYGTFPTVPETMFISGSKVPDYPGIKEGFNAHQVDMKKSLVEEIKRVFEEREEAKTQGHSR